MFKSNEPCLHPCAILLAPPLVPNHAGRGTLRAAIKGALDNSWGLMRERTDKYLQPGQAFPNNQADIYYVPARFQAAYVEFAAQFQAQLAMSEAALPNIFGLLKERDTDIDFMTFAMAWDNARACLEKGIKEVLPLKHDISFDMVRKCQGGPRVIVYQDKEHERAKSIFAIHPIKLSSADVLQRWLEWWLSQEC